MDIGAVPRSRHAVVAVAVIRVTGAVAAIRVTVAVVAIRVTVAVVAIRVTVVVVAIAVVSVAHCHVTPANRITIASTIRVRHASATGDATNRKAALGSIRGAVGYGVGIPIRRRSATI